MNLNIPYGGQAHPIARPDDGEAEAMATGVRTMNATPATSPAGSPLGSPVGSPTRTPQGTPHRIAQTGLAPAAPARRPVPPSPFINPPAALVQAVAGHLVQYPLGPVNIAPRLWLDDPLNAILQNVPPVRLGRPRAIAPAHGVQAPATPDRPSDRGVPAVNATRFVPDAGEGLTARRPRNRMLLGQFDEIARRAQQALDQTEFGPGTP